MADLNSDAQGLTWFNVFPWITARLFDASAPSCPLVPLFSFASALSFGLYSFEVFDFVSSRLKKSKQLSHTFDRNAR
jgi:hypothetical protein